VSRLCVRKTLLGHSNCRQQPQHIDYNDDSEVWELGTLHFRATFVIALEDFTGLMVMRDSLEKHAGMLEEITLTAGDVLCFHSLLVHMLVQ
jgi:hypothetical protein